MQTSLGNLVSNLKPDDFHDLKKYYKELQLLLLTRKGVYPYDYDQSLKSFSRNTITTKIRMLFPIILSLISLIRSST